MFHLIPPPITTPYNSYLLYTPSTSVLFSYPLARSRGARRGERRSGAARAKRHTNMSGNGGGVLCGVCTCFIVIPSLIMIMMSFSSLPTVEYGLDYNAITLTVDNRTYDSAGLYFLGLGHSFIKFPRTIQTIEFNAAHDDLLHTRTLDGLPLTLGVSFQYRYIPQHLYELYRAYKLKHVHVYENTATAVIANVACNYSAYTSFNDKQGIATVMGRPHPNPRETRTLHPIPSPDPGPSTRSRSPGCTQAGYGEGAGQDLRAQAVRAGGRAADQLHPAAD